MPSGGIFGAVNNNDLSPLTGNKVIINGGATSQDWITGALHYTNVGAAASGNSVVINGGTIKGNVTGARGGTAGTTGNVSFTGNSVSITGGNVEITGATVDNNARLDGAFVYIDNASYTGEITATGNSVSISGGNVTAPLIIGTRIAFEQASSASATATNNSVSITGGTATAGQVIGAFVVTPSSGAATATGNTVTVGGDTKANLIAGGAAVSESSGAATATGNTVTVGGNAEVGTVYAGYGASSGVITATGNAATVGDNAKITNALYVGWDATAKKGVAAGNTLTKTSAASSIVKAGGLDTVGFTYSGAANIATLETDPAGATAVTLNTNDNAVSFDGMITGSGGIAKAGAGTLTLAAANSYAGGTSIDAGTLRLADAGAASSGEIAAASGANLELAFDGTLANAVSGAGGLTADAGAGTVTLAGTNSYTGMTTVRTGTLALGSDLASKDLTMHANTTFKRGAAAHSLDGGSLSVLGQGARYEGDLVATNAAVSFVSEAPLTAAMLTVDGSAALDNSQIKVSLPGNVNAANGTSYPLLRVTAGNTITGLTIQNSGSVKSGSTVMHDLRTTLSADGTQLLGTLSNGRALPQAKALSEAFLGGMALTLRGADLAAGLGMDSAVRAAHAGNAGGYGIGAFGMLTGGSLRYNTGSHIDMNSINLMTGLSFGADLPAGRLTAGAFFEYGNGSYNTHNSISGAASVDGDGFAYYLGGGVLGRMDFLNTGPGHAYVEASGRTGVTYNDSTNSDLRDARGRAAEYDITSSYYSLHLGTGYIWNIMEKLSLDTYAKYFWTRQEGGSATLSTGESLEFRHVDSHRVRLGSRIGYAVNEHVTPYLGAAWEYEFDGKARGTTNKYDISAPDLMGSTGIGELGLSLKPSQELALSFDLGVQGYVGKREGVTGALQVKFEF